MDYRRFFTTLPIENDIVTLTGEEFFHCVKVTRHKINFNIIVNNNTEFDYLCKIIDIQKDYLKAEVLEKTKNVTNLSQSIVLYQAVGKEFDFIAQKAVELGVNKIIPFYSEFSQQNKLNLDRINKIILESVKQCGRSFLPILEKPLSFSEMLICANKHINKIFCYEKCSYEHKISNTKIIDGDIAIIIGSEGGFSEKEISLVKDMQICSLGKRILRAETASIVAIALLESRIGEL